MGLVGQPSRKQYNWQEERVGPELRSERRDILYYTLQVDTPQGDTTNTLVTVPEGFRATLISYYVEHVDTDLVKARFVLDGTVIRNYNASIVGTSFFDATEYKYEEAPRFYKNMQYVTDTIPAAGPYYFIIIGYILEPAGEGYITKNN